MHSFNVLFLFRSQQENYFPKKKKGRVRIQYKYDERYFFRSTVRDQNNKKKNSRVLQNMNRLIDYASIKKKKADLEEYLPNQLIIK